MRQWPWVVAFVSVSALCSACQDPIQTESWVIDPPDYEDAGDTTPPDAETPDVPDTPEPDPTPDPDPAPDGPWEDCSFFTGGGGDRVECADFLLPLSHDDPEGPQVEIFVKRIPAEGVSEGQLWLLQGGPGGAGDGLEGLAETIIASGGKWDIYIPDHRGTGRSGRLGCPRYERITSEGTGNITDREWPDCLALFSEERAQSLPFLNTTEAARDLGAILAVTRRNNEPVHFLGISYGTYWAHRFLQLYPQKITSAVLDSVCPPGLCDGSTYDYWYNETGRDFMDMCRDDALCREKLGDDPWAFASSVMDKLDNGHCPDIVAAGLGRTNLRKTLAAFLSDWELRVFIPAVFYRMDRCDREDVVALANLMSAIGLDTPPLFEPALFSPLLNLHITFSEMWADNAPSREDLAEVSRGALISPDATLALLDRYDGWPRYTADEHVGQWAQTDIPLLMINGTLDPQTPLATAEPAAEIFSGPNQHFVPIPNAAHVTTMNAPTVEGPPCGLSIAMAFLLDTSAPPDIACFDALKTVDFSGREDYANWLLGTPDMWENPQDKSGSAPAARPEGLDRAIRLLNVGIGR